MPPIRCYQVDAFTDRPFAGNPAAVCLLDEPREAAWMQSVAAEMNLSETAFVRLTGDAYELRWFTPRIEVELCGHATLASSHALWSEGIESSEAPIRFQTLSGELTCTADGDLIRLDFPSTPVTEAEPPAGLLEALQTRASFVGRSKFDEFVCLDSEKTLRALQPDFVRLRGIAARGIIVTSPSENPCFDFVSRFFAPAAGINEDPVTGSAHCALAHFWGGRLGKTEMTGFQASERGGTVHVRRSADRVVLGGRAVTVFRGELASEASS
ncbi:MAG: PhzF family phenazine biosynthesis protein [Planctomycetota bacterium]